jgi:sulfur carrier protein
MRVTINGLPMELDAGCTVAGLIERLKLTGRPVAVELNRDVVPRSLHGATRLADGDRLEVVALVGGG